MTSQALVHECVVGVQQVQDASVLAHDAAEEHFGLTPKGLPEILVEVFRLGLDRGELSQIQPLTGKIADKGIGFRIGQHASHLLLAHLGIAEPAFRGEIQQFVVGNAAPEEKRQARRQREIVHPVHRTGRQPCRFLLSPVQEPWGDEHSRQCLLNTGFEVSFCLALLVEPHQRFDLVVEDRTAKRATGDCRHDFPCARNLLIGIRGPLS